MSLLHGPLEALLTADDNSIGTPQGAAPLPHFNPVVWISFSGGPNDSVTLFIQSVQRVAFQHNRIEDDKWIAQLASTCFTDTALVWYLGLEKETQTSWAKLRIALVQRYLIQGATQTPQPVVAVPAQSKLSPTEPSGPGPELKDVGIVEVLLPRFGDVLGYLSQDSLGNFVVDPNTEKALKLQTVLHTDSDQPLKKIYSLRLLNAPDPRFPFLGLKLVKFPGENPNIVPQWDSKTGWNPIYDVPACCKVPPAGYRKPSAKTTSQHATWDFVQATESDYERYYIRKAEGPDPKTRVVSAIWTISDSVNRMARIGLTWPDGNDTNEIISEIQLEAFLHTDGITGLHAHSRCFATRPDASSLGLYSYESHVVLVFKQVSSP